MALRLAAYSPAGHVGVGANPVGLQVANAGLFRALARHGGFDRLDILSNAAVAPADLAADLLGGHAAATHLVPGSILDTRVMAEAGALLRGSPDLVDLAWLRRRTMGDTAYSLLGVIHTIAPPAVRNQIAEAAVGPMHPWDALICTSPSVREAMERLFDEWGEYLSERFGSNRRHRPHLPLVPLGVDQAAFQELADRPDVRSAVRAELGIAADDVLVLWVGRLSFFEKAFPQPMFRAVEEAGQAAGRRVHFVMAGWFANGETDRERYEQAARAYAPTTPVRFLDGSDRERVGGLWAAADVFLSLIDNVQETFGITPVEAMAAGLPVVVSDWDGYRYTVRDGQDGFLIPTLLGPAGGFGHTLAIRHALQVDPYQNYVGTVAQSTAVHVGRAAEALAALVKSPELRRRMGAAGRARVRELFDWRVVAGQINALVDDLSVIRADAAAIPGFCVVSPIRDDPFRAFVGFATDSLSPETRLTVRPGVDAGDLERAGKVDLDRAFAFWRASAAEAARILDLVAAGEADTVQAVLDRFPEARRAQIEASLVWMAKLGLLDWLPPAD